MITSTTNQIVFDPATRTMSVYQANNEHQSVVYPMVLTGVNADGNSATVSFTLTIVRDCSTATVLVPAAYASLSRTYKINA